MCGLCPMFFLLIFVIWAHLDKNKSSRPRFLFGLCPIASPTKILLAAQNLQTLSCLVCSHCQSVHTFPKKKSVQTPGRDRVWTAATIKFCKTNGIKRTYRINLIFFRAIHKLVSERHSLSYSLLLNSKTFPFGNRLILPP